MSAKLKGRLLEAALGVLMCVIEFWPLLTGTLVFAAVTNWVWQGWLLGLACGVVGLIVWQLVGWIADNDEPELRVSLIGLWLNRRERNHSVGYSAD